MKTQKGWGYISEGLQKEEHGLKGGSTQKKSLLEKKVQGKGESPFSGGGHSSKIQVRRGDDQEIEKGNGLSVLWRGGVSLRREKAHKKN